MEESCVFLQSGGPTCVINSTLQGLIETALNQKEIDNIYGSLYGIDGLINDNLIDLRQEDIKQIRLLRQTPGAILGTTRHILSSDFNDKEYLAIKDCIIKHNIHYIFIIGGNDSMDTCNKLSLFFQKQEYKCSVIGLPKTIDNDLIMIDHAPGYGSAIKYISNVFSNIECDTSSYDKGRVTIIEIMGRDAGWLTAGSKLASLDNIGPDLIYLPEVAFDLNKFLKDVKKIYDKKHKVIVAVSEGIIDKEGNYILNLYKYLANNDVFGHQQLGGVSNVLANIVKERLNIPVRAIELNLMQRCDIINSSLTDIDEAYNLGCYSIKQALSGLNGKMVGYDENHIITTFDLNEVANKVKHFPIEWIKNGNDIKKDFIKYAKPLIKGQNKIFYKNGLVKHAIFKKIKI